MGHEKKTFRPPLYFGCNTHCIHVGARGTDISELDLGLSAQPDNNPSGDHQNNSEARDDASKVRNDATARLVTRRRRAKPAGSLMNERHADPYRGVRRLLSRKSRKSNAKLEVLVVSSAPDSSARLTPSRFPHSQPFF